MYLRTVQLGIQDLAGHPWLLHACAIWAGISFLRVGFDAFSCCAAGEVVRCVLVRSVWKRLAPVRLQSLSGAPLAPSCRLPCFVLVSRCSLPGVAGTGTQSLSPRAQPP